MVGGAPGGPYQKLPKPLKQSKTTKTTKTIKNHQNLMEIKGNGRGCPRGALPQTTKTTKTSKNNQNHKNKQKPPNLMEIKRKWQGVHQGSGVGSDGAERKIVGGAPGWPYHKPPKPQKQLKTNKTSKTRKNNQNHQNDQTPPNLMEIRENGKAYPREAVGDLMGLK